MRRPLAGLAFFLALVGETLGSRRFGRVLARRLAGTELAVEGLDSIPAAGPFVLAVNHYRAGATLAIVAAAVCAAARARPEAGEELLVVVGQRHPPPRRLLLRALRWLTGAFFRQWARNVVRIPWGNATPALASLRELRRRAERQPILVFPEGRASEAFGEVRTGAGRFLARMPAPTLPVAVWPEGTGYCVVLGPPVAWARRSELHDLQLGLAIAAMLPERFAPEWQEPLGRWRAAHA
jgi:1-acyl-sn-glycerol-3-phosphate acyltransferase